MSFEWFIARRYLVARRRQALISLISLVSIIGVSVGVMALIVALALMTGVQAELRDRIVGSTAHVQVYKIRGAMDGDAEIKRLSAIPGVVAAAPAIIDRGLMNSTPADTAGVMIKGIDPEREARVTDIRSAMKSGSIEAVGQESSQGHAGVALGFDLAKKLDVEVDDEVRVMTGQSWMMTPAGISPALPTVLRVAGIFQLGFYDVDSNYALVSIPTAERMLTRSGPDYIQLRLARLDDAPAMRSKLQKELGDGYFVQDWTELNKSLYSALALEKMAISLTIGLIVAVAALNIVGSLVLLVMEKSPDIAILRTMGASAQSIRRVFMLQGLAIGLVGTLTGTALGLLVCYIANRYRLVKLDPAVYQISYLPFHVLPLDVVVVFVSAVAVCYLATVYPSRQAGALDPAEALRNL
jgi:lipoprotein-releasing system permease protein